MTQHKQKSLIIFIFGLSLLMTLSAGCLGDNYEAIDVTYVGNTTPDNAGLISQNKTQVENYV